MLKSLVLPKLGDRVSDVLDKDADSLSEIVLEAAEHGLGRLRPVLHVATIINVNRCLRFSPHRTIAVLGANFAAGM